MLVRCYLRQLTDRWCFFLRHLCMQGPCNGLPLEIFLLLHVAAFAICRVQMQQLQLYCYQHLQNSRDQRHNKNYNVCKLKCKN